MARKTPRRTAARKPVPVARIRPHDSIRFGASWWSRLPEAAQHAICLGTLLTIGIIFYAPILFGGQLIGGDMVKWRMMAASMMDYHDATGQEPLWSPNTFGGMPGYMVTRFAWIPGVDSIPNWLRNGLGLWPISHFAFLLGGAYVLGWWLTREKWAGMVLAVGFGFTTYIPIILSAGHNSKYIALAYTPWLVLAFASVLRKPKLLGALLFAVALAVHLRSGHPQITYYALWTIAIWWIADGVGSWREGLIDRWARATGWLTGGGLVAALMVAYPYLLQRDYKSFTIRGAFTDASGGLDQAYAYAMNWSHTLGELLTLIVPNAYGGGSSDGMYWGEKIFTSGPHYVGGVVILLAVVALLLSRRRVAVWALSVSAGLMLLFALGSNLDLLNRPLYDLFPLFDAFRVPETWLVQVAFCLAVLAALGLAAAVPLRRLDAAVEARSEADEARRSQVVTIAVATTLGFVVVFALAGPSLLSFEKVGEVESAITQIAQENQVSPTDPRVRQAAEEGIASFAEDRRDLFSADAWRTVLFVFLAGGVLILGRRGTIPAWAVQMSLALLIVVDLAGVGKRYIDADKLPLYDQELTELPNFAAYDFDEFVVRQVEAEGGPGHFRTFSMIEGDPTTNARPGYHYESVGGYHGAKLRIFQDWLDHLLTDPSGGISPNGLRLLGVRYVVAGQPIPGYEVAYQGDQTGVLVLRDPNAPPRAYFVGEVETLPNEEAVWARVHEPTFDPGRTALVEQGVEAMTTPIDSTSVPSVEITRFTPDEIVYSVETDAPRLLVASEVYYPAGWKAFVDGAETPILRVDHLLRGIQVPAGARE